MVDVPPEVPPGRLPRDVIANRDRCKLGGYVVGGAVRVAQLTPFDPGDRVENRRGLFVEISPGDNRNPTGIRRPL